MFRDRVRLRVRVRVRVRGCIPETLGVGARVG